MASEPRVSLWKDPLDAAEEVNEERATAADDDFERFLRQNRKQFKNMQRAMEIMTAYTVNGFNESPGDAPVLRELIRQWTEELGAHSNSPADVLSNLATEFGVVLNGFESLTGAIIWELSLSSGEPPQHILARYGELAAEVQSEAEVRGINDEER